MKMAFSQEQTARYARQFLLREIGVKGQKKLLDSKVLVIGAGALGSSALLYLAAAGVGTIGIADDDCVERSNLQRQILHTTDRVGMAKTESARLTLESLNPDVTVQLHPHRVTADNLLELIRPYDFIIDGTDRFATKFLINDGCVLAEKPYSHCGAVRFEGQTMTYVPHQGPCLRCLLDRVPPASETVTCAQAGMLGAVTGVLGSIQALEAIKYLLNIGDLLVGRVLTFDGLSMKTRITELPHSAPRCAVCGSHPTILSLTDNRREYEEESCDLSSINSGDLL